MISTIPERHCESELFHILSWGSGKRYYREEELHSNIIAWLFHPNESHGLGAKFTQAIFDRIKADISLGSDYAVDREASKTKDSRYRKADITIGNDREYVAIENKWNAKLGHEQMPATYKRFKSKAKNRRFTYIVLARSSSINIDKGVPHILTSYSVFCDVLRELLPFLKKGLPAMLLSEYVTLLSEKAPKW